MKHADQLDGIYAWCNGRNVHPDDIVRSDTGTPSDEIGEVDCPACLRAIIAYGNAADERLHEINKDADGIDRTTPCREALTSPFPELKPRMP